MFTSISASEPAIVQEAEVGELFLVHTPELQECVCTVLNLLDWFISSPHPARVQIVVIGCRVCEGEPGFLKSGNSISIHQDTPISRLEQVETACFRGSDVRRSHHSP